MSEYKKVYAVIDNYHENRLAKYTRPKLRKKAEDKKA